MNWKSPAILLGFAITLSFSTADTSFAQETGDEPEMSPEAQAEMAAWMKLAQPGEHHQHLAPYEGRWKSKIKMWMAPDTEPMLNEAESEAKWTLGGRFMEWHHSGDFAGMPFMARQFDGYNNGDGRYESVWMDNFGTLILTYQGECSDDGKTRVTTGGFSDPISGGTIEQRNVYTWIDEDHFKYESFMKKDGQEYQNMEMLYERQ